MVDDAWAANWPSQVTVVGDGAALFGELEEGQPMELSWAQQSDVACFPGTQNDAYEGPHVLFAMQQEAERFIDIRVHPEAGVDLSIFSIQQATNSFVLPPDTESAVACEASLTAGAGEPEDLSLWKSSNPYNVVIGVAGVADQPRGRFLLEITSSE